MQLGHTKDEIKYDTTEGTIARYVVVLEGEPTMYVTCDIADPEKVIRIRRFKTSVDVFDTFGRFAIKTEFLTDPDGMPLGMGERVDETSVYTYVVPRLYVLLGRLLRAA